MTLYVFTDNSGNMHKPTIKPDLSITLHRDGTVSYWCTYAQQWKREHACNLYSDDTTLATLDRIERFKIRQHAHRWSAGRFRPRTAV